MGAQEISPEELVLSPNRYRRMFQKVGVFEVGGMDGGALKRLEAREIRINP